MPKKLRQLRNRPYRHWIAKKGTSHLSFCALVLACVGFCSKGGTITPSQTLDGQKWAECGIFLSVINTDRFGLKSHKNVGVYTNIPNLGWGEQSRRVYAHTSPKRAEARTHFSTERKNADEK